MCDSVRLRPKARTEGAVHVFGRHACKTASGAARVLHPQQSLRVADVIAEVLRERGCDVSQAGIELTDPRYSEKFSRFPFRHAAFDLLAVLPAQLRRATGQITIPDAAREGACDLVCFGSATWFFTTNMPLRSYLKCDEAGKILAGRPFAAYVVCRRFGGAAAGSGAAQGDLLHRGRARRQGMTR